MHHERNKHVTGLLTDKFISESVKFSINNEALYILYFIIRNDLLLYAFTINTDVKVVT